MLYRLSVDQYHQLAKAGILIPSDRVELIEGLLVQKMTRHPPHTVTVKKINRLLNRLLSEEWSLGVQTPITTTDSEPEPDFSVALGPEERYAARHPGPGDLELVIEVSDSTLEADRDQARIYARARIPVYWIVNIPDRKLEVYSQPRAGKKPAYRVRTDLGEGASVSLVLGGHTFTLAVRDLLPPAPGKGPR
jgi:Uma2 family endonuclease